MFRKKDDLEEYYKERKKEKKYNKYEIELERKVLGKENHQIFQKFLGIIIGVAGIAFIISILIKQSFIIRIMDNPILTVVSGFIIPVIFFITAFFLESTGNENKKRMERGNGKKRY